MIAHDRRHALRAIGALAAGLLCAASCSLRIPRDEEAAQPDAPATVAPAAARVGEEAPDFELFDLEGKPVRLAELRGRIVVLEWFDPGCTFAEHGHRAGSLKELSRRLTEGGVVWLAVNSSGAGKPGSAPEENRGFVEQHALGFPILLDPSGEVGRAYGAAKVPQTFVIDENGVLAYAGPADNAPFGMVKGGGPVIAYVEEVVDALRAGRPVEKRKTKLYGCAIKYASS